MKRFIKKVFILILLVSVLFSALVIFDYKVVGSQYKYSYNAAILDKLDRLKSIEEPKIILVGNSNVAYGFDSKLIEEEFNMPVVNMGLHAGLGNVFHEEAAKQGINSGDIVIVCHSDYSDTDTIGDAELALLTYDYNDEVFSIFRKKDYKDLIKAYPTYLRKSYLLWLTHRGNLKTDNSYCRDAFNEYGDVTYKPIDKPISAEFFKKNHSALPKVSKECVARLNELNDYCNQRGATLLVAGYPIEHGEYDTYTKEEIIKFQNELSDKLDCPVISDFTDYMYPYDYFYNAILHLNEKGAKARSEQLISDLHNWIDNK